MAAARPGRSARAGASMAGHASTRGVGSHAPRLTIHLPSPPPGSQRQPGDLRDSRASPHAWLYQPTTCIDPPSSLVLCASALPWWQSQCSRRACRRPLSRSRSRAPSRSSETGSTTDGSARSIRSSATASAIASLPPDVLDYSNAKEEIARALAFAKQGKPDPGGEDPTPAVSTGTDHDRDSHDEHGTGPTRRRRTRHRPIRRRPAPTRPTSSGRTPRGPRRSRFRCSCSADSPFFSSRPGRPATSAAG